MKVLNQFFRERVTLAQSRNAIRLARMEERKKFAALCGTRHNRVMHVHLCDAAVMPQGKLDHAGKLQWLETLASENVQFSFHWQGKANRAHWKALSMMHSKKLGKRENVSIYRALPRLAIQFNGAWHRFIFMIPPEKLALQWQAENTAKAENRRESKAVRHAKDHGTLNLLANREGNFAMPLATKEPLGKGANIGQKSEREKAKAPPLYLGINPSGKLPPARKWEMVAGYHWQPARTK